MIKGGGKRKGASFERVVAVSLSKWCSKGEREDCFWRSAMSGGRATVSRKKGTNLAAQSGDLSAIHPMGQKFLDKFYVEIKSYQDLQYHGLITGTGRLVNFWNITVAEALSYNKIPLLIAKQNRIPAAVFMHVKGYEVLDIQYECAIIVPPLDAYGILFDNFLKLAKPI